MAIKKQAEFYIGIMRLSYIMANRLWQDRYPALSSAPGEVLDLDRETELGMRKIKQLQMGPPKFVYRSGGSTQYADFELLALREQEVALVTDTGGSGSWMSNVRVLKLASDETLVISIPFRAGDSNFKISYSSGAQNAVNLIWSGAAEYAYSGSERDEGLLRQYFNRHKKLLLTRLSVTPRSQWLQDVELRPDFIDDNYIHFLLFSALPGVTGGEGVLSVPPVSDVDDRFSMLSLAAAFPENFNNLRPFDSQWMASLLVPEGTALIDESQDMVVEGVGFNFGYKRARSRAMGHSDVSIASGSVSVNPLMAVVWPSANRVLLEIPDLGNATVELIGDRHGKLERESDACYYVPPLAQTPSVVYEEHCKTLENPALLETLVERAVFDVIRVTVNGNSALSTFVTLYAKQTHFIKYLVVNGELTLQLWYYDVEQAKDVLVPADETEWSTLHGGGSVSSLGVFTPGSSNPSTVSVIAGRDLGSSRLLFWAVTIIPVPLYSVTEAVRLFND